MIAAVMMVKDEADIIRSTVRHLISQGIERLFIYDNMSTDNTVDEIVAADHECRVQVIVDTERGYYQSDKMTELARIAGHAGAEWIVPVDADEFWYATDETTVAETLRTSQHDIECATSYEQYGRFRGEAKRLAKVAFRYQPGVKAAQGNHDVTGLAGSRGWGRLAIREYQYRSLGQLIRKVRNGKAAYDATDLHKMEGAHWREMGGWTDQELRTWWLNHRLELAVEDPPPWTL